MEVKDVESFVNSVLSDDAKISSVSMKLQIMSADLQDELEACMAELVATAPRASVEVRQIARALDGVEDEASGVARRASRLLMDEAQTLEDLEVVKKNFKEALAILVEDKKWQNLKTKNLEALEKFTAQKDMSGAEELAQSFEELAQSEKVLAHMPEAEGRKVYLNKLRDEVEAALRPRVARAVGASSTDLRDLASLYDKLGLSDSLRRDYASARPAKLHRRWFARPRQADEEEKLRDWLADFLEDAIDLVTAEERAWDKSVAAMVARAVFAPLTSSFADRLDLTDIVDIYECRLLCDQYPEPLDEPFQVKYAAKEADYLVKVTNERADSYDKGDLYQVLEGADTAVTKLFEDCSSAVVRCHRLGNDSSGLLRATRDATTVAAQRLASALQRLQTSLLEDGLPLDTSLISDCWKYAKKAFESIALAGKIERQFTEFSATTAVTISEWDENLETTLSPFERVAVERCLDHLSSEACALTFELSFSPIRAALRRISTTRFTPDNVAYCRPATWCQGTPSDTPHEYVTVVGAHLLSALQELEPFLAGDNIRDALAARVDAAGRSTDGAEWAKLGDALELSDADRLGLRSLASGNPVDLVTLGPVDDHVAQYEEEAAARFCTDWLACLQRATVAAFLDEIVRVDKIDDVGAAQLTRDLSYLLNVANALDLPKHAVLVHLNYLAQAKNKSELDVIVRRDLPNNPAANVLRKIEIIFATARAHGSLPSM